MEIKKWIIYTIGFAAITTPIHLQVGSSIFTWLSISLIIGFFAGILNNILSELKKSNSKNSK